MSRITTCITRTKNSDIIYCLSVDDYQEFTKLINEANVNNVIDTKNGYTSLHYAVKLNNDKMIDYLLSMGANPYLKTYTHHDSFDLSLKYQSKSVITYELNEKKELNNELKKIISSLEKKISNAEANTKYLVKSVDEFIVKTNILKNQVSEVKKDNFTLKSINSSLVTKNCSLSTSVRNLENTKNELNKNISCLNAEIVSLNKNNEELVSTNTSLKRKFHSLEDSYSGLLNKIRK